MRYSTACFGNAMRLNSRQCDLPMLACGQLPEGPTLGSSYGDNPARHGTSEQKTGVNLLGNERLRRKLLTGLALSCGGCGVSETTSAQNWR